MMDSTEEWERSRWLQVLTDDGTVWMETSDPDEVYAESERTGWPVKRLWERHEREWRPDETEKL